MEREAWIKRSMDKKKEINTENSKNNYKILEAIGILILILLPMRHVTWGLDLWDTGYNYANYTYMGLEHMDSMWLYSTYLSTVIGHLFSMLPGGGTLVGMNVYTGLTVSILGVLGYWFYQRKLGISKIVAFGAQVLAICLCWCPTAKLYDYLTYLLFSTAAVLVYLGLAKEKKRLLILAGICLGLNVLVRFSNIPEAGLILAVWAYAFWKTMENRKQASMEGEKKQSFFGQWMRLLWKDTLWCLVGYLAALVVCFGWIAFRYGIGDYIEGIQRLFAMTENATDYQANSMLKGSILPYKDMVYWFIRILIFTIAGTLMYGMGECFAFCCKSEKIRRNVTPVINVLSKAGMVAIFALMIYWLYHREFVSFMFYSYDGMYRPTALLLFVTLILGVVNALRPGVKAQERLLAAIVVLVIFLTSLGSNTNIMPSMNHLFLVAPYTIWQQVLFNKWSLEKLRNLRTEKQKGNFDMTVLWECGFSAWPVCISAWMLIAMLFVHAIGFGAFFAFAESTGIQEIGGTVTGSKVLKGVTFKPDRAVWVQDSIDFINANALIGKDSISFGNIPAVSFYYEMPAAFNPWCDLDSYNVRQMEKDLRAYEAQMDAGQKERPVLMLEHTYHCLALGQRMQLEEEGMNPEWLDVLEASPKWELLQEFISKYDYQPKFDCKKLAIWQ